MKHKIYLDNNSTTQVDPAVLQVMTSYMESTYGNPSSQHAFGRNARAALVDARDVISAYLDVKPREIVFTSGGTEGLNFVLRGLTAPCHIITSDVEHIAVYETLKILEKRGFQVTFLKAGHYGAVGPEAVREAITPQTKLIALMSVNNETGVKTDIEGIALLASQYGIPFMVDSVAHFGKEKILIPKGVSAMCFSGQKVHAPMGTGFVFLRTGFKLDALTTGGEQELGRRAGTENVPGIVALAEAVRLLKFPHQMELLRDRFESELLKIPNVVVNGEGPRVCNTTNLSFIGRDGESLLAAFDREGIAASHGSACSSGALEPSRVLINMGLPKERVRSAIRFSLSRYTTAQDIEEAIDIIKTLTYIS